MTPYFSITIPVYNVEKYIRQCLDSVIGQTFGDFEVIILDDGSTDDSGIICDEYARKDSRIKVIHDVNMGLLMARRRALQHVNGEYVLFLDSDDYWEIDLLETVFNTLKKSSVDMVFLRYRAVDSQGKELYQQKKLLKDREIIRDAGKFLCYKLATGFEYNPMWLKVIKREVLDIEGDYLEVHSVSMGEDALQSVRISNYINSMLYLENPYYNYRVNISSISTKVTDKYLEDYLKVRTEIESAFGKYYTVESKEFFKKLAYDIRGIIGLLADGANSSLIEADGWYEMKQKILRSSIFRNAFQMGDKLGGHSKVSIFLIRRGNRGMWMFLGKIKKIIKYLYDRIVN